MSQARNAGPSKTGSTRDGAPAEGALASRAAAGDRAAFAELVGDWMPFIVRIVQKRAPKAALMREAPEDLAQSVCRDVLQRIERDGVEYRDEDAFRNWLLGAVDLKLRDRWRSVHTQQREGMLAPHVDVAHAPIEGSEPTPSEMLHRHEVRAELRALFDQLNERSRTIVERTFIHGEPHAIVAEDLGITAANSRQILARALARLASLALE